MKKSKPQTLEEAFRSAREKADRTGRTMFVTWSPPEGFLVYEGGPPLWGPYRVIEPKRKERKQWTIT